MRQTRILRPRRTETATERLDRLAPVLDLEPRDPDVVRAKALDTLRRGSGEGGRR